METGILFNGMYLGSMTRQRSDGKTSFVVAVACGLKAYEINMDQFVDLSKMSVGAPLLITAEPNVYKGNLYWQHGQICARS